MKNFNKTDITKLGIFVVLIGIFAWIIFFTVGAEVSIIFGCAAVVFGDYADRKNHKMGKIGIVLGSSNVIISLLLAVFSFITIAI